MKILNKMTLAACLLLAIASCKKTEDLNVHQSPGLGGDTTSNTAIDKWIMDSLTTPYNISVKYRWDPWNASLYNDVTPTDESKVIPLFSALKTLWINPYNQETGSELFIKTYCPKQLVLLGSVEYATPYLVLLGQAEGGNNIVLFDVNENFSGNHEAALKTVVHTAHHEFAHALHQTVLYPADFKGISAKLGLPGYTSTWFNVSEEDAFDQGYASAYSRATSDEDFVEMVSIMLTEGRIRWEEKKAATNALARQALQQKEDIVVTYFRQVWKIDFYSLQSRVQAGLATLFPPPAVADAYGFGKTYTRASVNPANTTLLPQPAAFTTMFNSAKSAVAALPGGFNLVLDSMAVITNTASTAIVRMYLHQGTGTTALFADFSHSFIKDAAGLYSFTFVSANSTGNLIKTAVAPLLNYFANNTFSITWYADPSVSSFPRLQFTPTAIPGTYFIARVLP